MALPKITDPVDNISSQPDQPIISATNLKALFDEIGKDIKEFINNVFTVFLEGSSAASNLGQNNGSYGPTIQDAIDTITSAGIGTIPPDGTISNLKLATDVKVGSLATLLTTIKTSVVGAINELSGYFVDVTSAVNKLVFKTSTTGQPLVIEATGTDANIDINLVTKGNGKIKSNGLNLAIPEFIDVLTSDYTNSTTSYTQVSTLQHSVESGKRYRIELALRYTRSTSGAVYFSVYLPSGSGTIIGETTNLNSGSSVGTQQFEISAIGSLGLSGSEILSVSAGVSPNLATLSAVFTCATSGIISLGGKSANAATTLTLLSGSVFTIQELV